MTADGNHKNATTVHIVCNWEYVDAAERLAATGFDVTDVGKFAWQADNDSVWMLADADQACVLGPLWVPVGIASLPDLDDHPGSFASGDKLLVSVSGVIYKIDYDDLPGSSSGISILGFAEYTTDQSVTTIADLTNMSLTYNQVVGQEYVHYFSYTGLKTTQSSMDIYITDESNNVIGHRIIALPTGFNDARTITFVETAGSSGAVTRKVRASCTSGSFNFNNDDNSAMQFWAEG